MRNHFFLITLMFALSHTISAQMPSDVKLHWIDSSQITDKYGLSWGIPFKQGEVKKNQNFSLRDGAGKLHPVQTWTMAYWPDGSVKWNGFATVANHQVGPLTLCKTNNAILDKQSGLEIIDRKNYISINTGKLICVLRKNGDYVIDSLLINNQLVAERGRLECILQNGADGEDFESPRKTKFTTRISTVTIEQGGPVRAVVRIQGNMYCDKTQRAWLPFNIRLYFYMQSQVVRMVNTIIYNGDAKNDLIKGLGLVFTIPMRDSLINRHVRFGGESGGIWAEPVKPLYNKKTDTVQISGKPISLNDPVVISQKNVRMPIWNDFKLVQSNADGFNIQKRTNIQSTWLDANAGHRAAGYVFVGDNRGGLGVGLKDFWQSYPAALEVRDASKPEAELKVWLWSPYQ